MNRGILFPVDPNASGCRKREERFKANQAMTHWEAVVPLLVFVAGAATLAGILLLLAKAVHRGRSNPVKQMPYESGVDPIHDSRRPFDVRFYLVAVAFLVFDVEVLFLYPWAAASGGLNGNRTVAAAGGDRAGADPSGAVVRTEQAVGPANGAAHPVLSQAAGSPVGPIASPTARNSSVARDSDEYSFNDSALDAAVAAGWISGRNAVFGGVTLFFALFVLGLAYDWRKGVFQWR